MNPATVIELAGIGKRYNVVRSREPDTLVKSVATRARRLLAGARQDVQEIWAIRDVALTVRAGEAVGIIGANGAGKSTLLKILSRVTEPTVGRLSICGRVASLLEVGAGFHGDLTCRQNVFLYGAVLGMTRREIASRFDQIIAFAGLEQFVEEPVKHLSSGMYLRLAFSVAVFLDSEILIVDEVLSVGDSAFQLKCIEHIQRAGRSGRTVLFVSHDLALVSQLASRTLLLENGRVVFDGPTATALQRHLSDKRGPAVGRVATDGLACRARYRAGGAVVIREIGFPGAQGGTIRPGGDIALEALVECRGSHEGLRFLYSVNSSTGQAALTGFTPPFSLSAGTTLVGFAIRSLNLAPGAYDFTLSIGQGGLADGKIEYDAYRGIGSVTISESVAAELSVGYWRPEWGPVFHERSEILSLTSGAAAADADRA